MIANKRAPRFKARGYMQKFLTNAKKSINKFNSRIVKNPTSTEKDPNDRRIKSDF
jgi:hypothetical protein